ncbi:MAG: DEAD/DEAH box helicase [Methylotenera sp.]|nr:DEAD/DEAH box helicase [Oligoflexia bacterium]
MSFDSLNLIAPILNAVKAEGYETPTPIQLKAIPLVLARKDVLACAQTGTGKTAAFALPILQLLSEGNAGRPIAPRPIRVLILTPTRELASQIAESFTNYGQGLHIRNTVIFGGVNQNPQVRAVKQGVDVLVATPGRLLDLMNQRLVSFNGLEIFVLDEADRMLDMGFIHDVRRIITAIPKKRQTLFFSATMPPEIRKLSEQILTQPVRIEVAPVSSTAEKIEQAVYHVDKKQKMSLLIDLLSRDEFERTLVFTRTKRDANRVSDSLSAAGIESEAIHGNKSQNARERALEKIKAGEIKALVATDIAARGIDITGVTHVVNFDIPNIPESYVHRIGRTARAGKEGTAYSLCAADERQFLLDIERLIRLKIRVLETPRDLPMAPKTETKNREREYRDPRAQNQKRRTRSGGSTSERSGGSDRGGYSASSGTGFGGGGSASRGPSSRPSHSNPSNSNSVRPVSAFPVSDSRPAGKPAFGPVTATPRASSPPSKGPVANPSSQSAHSTHPRAASAGPKKNVRT